MTRPSLLFRNGRIFDGTRLLDGHVAAFRDGCLTALVPEREAPQAEEVVDLAGDILSPGYVDLQVNGGDGLMLNDAPDVATLTRIAQAHRRLGCRWILPTLITDTPDKTRTTIEAAKTAIRQGVDGIAGLHLEGPHLSVTRKGAHDATLIRPMEPEDLTALCDAARALPALMVTIAPESVTPEQVNTLTQAGAAVSLGHTDADFDICTAHIAAGARCATHLFNAMSQLGNREPGLVGAALSSGQLSCGLIADGIHVHPQSMRAAFAAKIGPGGIFLVSDAMAVAGTELGEFHLEGRLIRREAGRLTLEDGTLAGADLDLTQALNVLVNRVGIPLDQALAAATTLPGRLIGLDVALAPASANRIADVIRISPDLRHCAPAI
ncbi:N-acetylglucosamine-6-phosphate deacetylase [Aliiroseovarius sp.]|uniref:N-acetylglucosamine-6-phosphate deacetylase n=1 Tax=Aliiroseovarius sp. TaxID=1872442 RepID=UPI003BAB1EE7